MDQVASSKWKNTTNSNRYIKFYYTYWLCVSLDILTHEQPVTVSTYLSIKHEHRPFSEEGSRYWAPIHTPLPSPLLTSGRMRSLVIGDWWVQKNKTVSILTPILVTMWGVNWFNWPWRQWRLHGAINPRAWLMKVTWFGQCELSLICRWSSCMSMLML